MQTVYFHTTWDEADEDFLDEIGRQTPGHSWEWGDVRGTTDPDEADYHITFNQADEVVDGEKLLLFSAEPPISNLYADWHGADALGKYPIENHYKPQRWWVSRDYDYLASVQSPEKNKDLSWITTDKGRNLSLFQRYVREALLKVDYRKFYQKNLPFVKDFPSDGQILRMKFLASLTEKYPSLLDLYGRGDFSGPHYCGETDDKWNGLAQYRYSLAIENYKGPNYFSEKLTDVLLAWCMPIYWGCANLDKYLPSDSFVEIDIEDPSAPDQVREIVKSDLREENLDAIGEARRRLLDEYQIWPTVDRVVSDLEGQQK